MIQPSEAAADSKREVKIKNEDKKRSSVGIPPRHSKTRQSQEKAHHRSAQESNLVTNKTNKVGKKVVSPKVIEEEDCERKISSTMNIHNQNSIIEAKTKSDCKSHADSAAKGQSRVGHQDTVVGLIEPRHIEDTPIHLDLSEEKSNVTERNNQVDETFKHEPKSPSDKDGGAIPI